MTTMIKPIKFGIAEKTIEDWAAMYMPLTVDGVEDKDGLAVVHAARMTVKQARIDVEKTRKELKADALEFGKKVDAEAKRITALLEPIEAKLAREEDAIEAEKDRIKQAIAEAKRAVSQGRIDEMATYGERMQIVEAMTLSDADFETRLTAAKLADTERKRIAAEQAEVARLAEVERQRLIEEESKRQSVEREQLAKAKAEMDAEIAVVKAQQEAIRLEQERLKHEADLQQRLHEARQREAMAVEEAKDSERKRIADEQAAAIETARLEREADAASAEAKAGREIAELFAIEAAANRWRVGDDYLIGQVCREAFIRRLAELLEVTL